MDSVKSLCILFLTFAVAASAAVSEFRSIEALRGESVLGTVLRDFKPQMPDSLKMVVGEDFDVIELHGIEFQGCYLRSAIQEVSLEEEDNAIVYTTDGFCKFTFNFVWEPTDVDDKKEGGRGLFLINMNALQLKVRITVEEGRPIFRSGLSLSFDITYPEIEQEDLKSVGPLIHSALTTEFSDDILTKFELAVNDAMEAQFDKMADSYSGTTAYSWGGTELTFDRSVVGVSVIPDEGIVFKLVGLLKGEIPTGEEHYTKFKRKEGAIQVATTSKFVEKFMTIAVEANMLTWEVDQTTEFTFVADKFVEIFSKAKNYFADDEAKVDCSALKEGGITIELEPKLKIKVTVECSLVIKRTEEKLASIILNPEIEAKLSSNPIDSSLLVTLEAVKLTEPVIYNGGELSARGTTLLNEYARNIVSSFSKFGNLILGTYFPLIPMRDIQMKIQGDTLLLVGQ